MINVHLKMLYTCRTVKLPAVEASVDRVTKKQPTGRGKKHTQKENSGDCAVPKVGDSSSESLPKTTFIALPDTGNLENCPNQYFLDLCLETYSKKKVALEEFEKYLDRKHESLKLREARVCIERNKMCEQAAKNLGSVRVLGKGRQMTLPQQQELEELEDTVVRTVYHPRDEPDVEQKIKRLKAIIELLTRELPPQGFSVPGVEVGASASAKENNDNDTQNEKPKGNGKEEGYWLVSVDEPPRKEDTVSESDNEKKLPVTVSVQVHKESGDPIVTLTLQKTEESGEQTNESTELKTNAGDEGENAKGNNKTSVNAGDENGNKEAIELKNNASEG